MNLWINRHWNLFSLLCLGAALGWILLTSPANPPGTGSAAQSGFRAPALALPDAAGNPLSLEEFNGQVIVLNFWASWCEPCKQEMPALEKAYKTYANQGLVILGVNATNSDQAASALRFAEAQGLTFPILFDQTGAAGQTYRIQLLPTTFFIGRDGIIRKVVSGGMSEAFILATIEDLLQEEPR